MRTQIILAVFFIFLSPGETFAQKFTRISTGAIVQDPGNNQGGSWGDFDNDGNVDLFITHTSGFGPNKPNLLYQNLGNRTFAKVTNGTIPNDVVPTSWGGASWADYDNDGDLDLFTPVGTFTATGLDTIDRLYRNDGNGNFTGLRTFPVSTTDGTWAEYNNDGYLDLFLGGIGGKNSVFVNNRNGTFTQIDTGAIAADWDWFYSPSWADFDNDGDMDVFWPTSYFDVSRRVKNRFFINQGNGFFTSLDTNAVVVSDDGWSAGGSWGDYDNDGNMDLFVASYLPVSRVNHLYHNTGDGTFTQLAIDSVESSGAINLGSCWGDFDNDGDLDLFVTSSRDFPDVPDQPTFRENLFFRNDGRGQFTRITTGDIVKDGGLTASAADYDNDGDLDILIINGSWGLPYINYLYSNDGNDNHWVIIRCLGTASNRSAIGARVRAKALINGSPVWQMREIAQMSGCHSNNDVRTHFGFGDATVIDSLIIRWPSGVVDTYTGIAVDNFYVAEEGASILPTFVGNIYAEHPSLGKLYARKNIDSVLFTTRYSNVHHHQFTSYAICRNRAGTQMDSMALFDDGLHSDSLAHDGLYGAYVLPRSVDDFYTISVGTVDLQLTKYTNVPDLGTFTTVPVRVDSTQYGTMTNFRYTVKPFLKNAGSGPTVKNITVKLSSPSVCAKSITPIQRTCVDLLPGQTSAVALAFVVTYDSATFAGIIDFTVEISSDGQPYWTEPIRLLSTGVQDEERLPSVYALAQNYPNPFNPSTTIRYGLPHKTTVQLSVFNTLGQQVDQLVNCDMEAGYHQVQFDGSKLASGVYLYRMQAGSFVETRKFLLVR